MSKYVKTDDVIKAVDKHTKDEVEIVLDDDITCILEEIPAADVRENVKGEWECSYCKLSDGNAVKIYFCPKCRMVDNDTPKFCKHCGADLRGEV